MWVPEGKSKSNSKANLCAAAPTEKVAREFKSYDWSTVAFTDEKRWCKRPDGPTKVWMRPGESRDPRCAKKVTKFGGGGIMVWGAISQTRKYPLIRVRGTLNAHEYISQILTPFLRAMPRASRRKPRLM